MTRPMLHDKIQPHHLGRRAVIYLRQSSEKQVRENKESQRLQYGLRDRAVARSLSPVVGILSFGGPERGEPGHDGAREDPGAGAGRKTWCQQPVVDLPRDREAVVAPR